MTCVFTFQFALTVRNEQQRNVYVVEKLLLGEHTEQFLTLTCTFKNFYDRAAYDKAYDKYCIYSESTTFILFCDTLKHFSLVYTVACPMGSFSATGLQPCTLCDRRSFQPNTGRRDCLLCPGTTVTKAQGSKSRLDCLGM